MKKIGYWVSRSFYKYQREHRVPRWMYRLAARLEQRRGERLQQGCAGGAATAAFDAAVNYRAAARDGVYRGGVLR